MDKYAHKQGCEWLFNPPHASHFGGAWERQIGTIRRVLDAMFAELGSAQLTHELLVTLMAEVTAIVNACPIALVPTDVDEPQPLSPSMLLTMKTRPAGTSPGVFVPTDLYAAVGGGEYNTSPTNSGYDGGGNTCKACSPEGNGRHPDKT